MTQHKNNNNNNTNQNYWLDHLLYDDGGGGNLYLWVERLHVYLTSLFPFTLLDIMCTPPQ